jgi:hypothetical protein
MKQGRGRPKGVSSYVELTYEELGDYVGKKAVVRVSRKWFDFFQGEANASPPPTSINSEEGEAKYPPIAHTVTNFNNE